MSEMISRRNLVKGAAASALVGAAGSAALAPYIAKASDNEVPESWDYEYDVVVCGAGGSGLVAALRAADEGARVICIDANFDIGGHAMVSPGFFPCGGGTACQEANGIVDSPEQYYLDHTDPLKFDSRWNKRDVIRECSIRLPEMYAWAEQKGVRMTHNMSGDVTDCDSVLRLDTVDATGYASVWNGHVSEGEANGAGVVRPLEEAARAQGVAFMMNRHMDSLVVDDTGRVIGVRASYTPRFYADGTQLTALHADEYLDDTADVVTIAGDKAVIIATGGGSGNVAYRRMFNPDWNFQIDSVAGEPYSAQDASGEIAGMAIGAGIASAANWCDHAIAACCPAGRIGIRYNNTCQHFEEGSPIWEFAGGEGLSYYAIDGVIMVNMLGKRFHKEDNGTDVPVGYDKDDRIAFLASALSSVVLNEGTDDVERVGGPIWAIFDSATAEANGWICEYPYVDTANGYFFSGETLEELAGNIVNKYYEDIAMPAENLVSTVEAYNTAVDTGEDVEFGRDPEKTTVKIEKGPFYAAWAVPNMHDCFTGLDTDAHRQVLRVGGEPIEGLFACGECAGGHRAHGLGKAMTAGYIAGTYAAQA